MSKIWLDGQFVEAVRNTRFGAAWVTDALPPPPVLLVSPTTSTTDSYLLEFASYSSSPPTAVTTQLNGAPVTDLLTPPPAPTLTATPGDFKVILETTGTGESFTLYRDGVAIHSYAGGSYSDPDLTAGVEYSYTATQTDMNGNVSAQSEPVTAIPTSAPQPSQPNLLADYRFTETSGDLIDRQNGYNGTPTAVTRNGSYYTGDGVNTRLPLALALETALSGKAAGHLGLLFRFPAVPAAVSTFASISAMLSLGISVTPRIRGGVRTANSSSMGTPTSLTLAANTWYYLSADYDGTRLLISADGVELGTLAKSGTLGNAAGDPYLFSGESQTQLAAGDIALLQVYDAALDAAARAENVTFAQHVITERAL